MASPVVAWMPSPQPMARPGLEPVRMASPVVGMDAVTATECETRTRTGPDGVPGRGHGCRHRNRVRDPGSNRSGGRPRAGAWMPPPQPSGETRTRTGDTTIFRDEPQAVVRTILPANCAVRVVGRGRDSFSY